jgi:hypothetical protein
MHFLDVRFTDRFAALSFRRGQPHGLPTGIVPAVGRAVRAT